MKEFGAASAKDGCTTTVLKPPRTKDFPYIMNAPGTVEINHQIAVEESSKIMIRIKTYLNKINKQKEPRDSSKMGQEWNEIEQQI